MDWLVEENVQRGAAVMLRFSLCLPLACLVAGIHAAAEAAPFPPQPLPPAAETLGPLRVGRAVTFSATPSLEFPGRAWVVRITPGTAGAGQLEIVRLRRQMDCNRYDIDK